MRAFDFGCHPLHGYIELSFLTTDETDEISSDSIWETVGDWRYIMKIYLVFDIFYAPHLC
jgi:hypothetical protein